MVYPHFFRRNQNLIILTSCEEVISRLAKFAKSDTVLYIILTSCEEVISRHLIGIVSKPNLTVIILTSCEEVISRRFFYFNFHFLSFLYYPHIM